jgi:glycosyltransferase involved in cell wall biosynthesis
VTDAREVVAHIVTRCVAGAGGVAVRGAVSLDPTRYRSILVTGTREGPLLDRARAHGVEVVVVPRLTSPVSPVNDVLALWRLVTVLRAHKVTIVHTHSAKAGALGRVAGRWVGARKVVHTLHGFPFHDFQGRLSHATYVAIERWLGGRTDDLLAVGTAVAVEALRRGIARPGQVHTIGPAVDPPTVVLTEQTRAKARTLLGIDQDVPVVGTVGRLDYQKAPEVMVEALRLMRHRAVLVWAGDGELAARTREVAAASGLADRVLLLGNRTDVPAILPAFDVFAMSSRFEGLPCAIVEAQQCGIPVVATAVNAVTDVVVPGETGLLVPPERPVLLAEALDYALDHPGEARQWAAVARDHLGHRYDPATLGRLLDTLYAGDREEQATRKPVAGSVA